MNGSVKPARKLAMHVRVTLVHATTVKLLVTVQNLAATGIRALASLNVDWPYYLPYIVSCISGTLIVIVVGTKAIVTGSLLTIGMCRVVPALATSVNQ